jgi:hypothetical protein
MRRRRRRVKEKVEKQEEEPDLVILGCRVGSASDC